jgi:hypothetical protein
MVFRRGKTSPALAVGQGTDAQVQRRAGGDLRVHRPPGPEPLPDAKHMPLGDPGSRELCWARLPPRAAARLSESAGERIEWWARRSGSGQGWAANPLPRAMVFGRKALCFAEPRVDSDHRPVYSLERYHFDPDSHRRAEVVFTPPLAAAETSGVEGLDGALASWETGAIATTVPSLSPSALELIGNLPVRAQKLLTAPFGPEHPVRRCEWYYEGSANRFDVFAVVLVGSVQATLAHGTRVIPAGHDDRSSHWSLVCRRATVRPRAQT